MNRRFPRNLSFETCEQRRLLAVDLVIEVDDFESAEIGEEVTRTVRVFNNSAEDATDAVVRATFPDLENTAWERQSGFAQFIENPPDDFEAPSDYVVKGMRRPELIGDVNHDGVMDVFAGSPETGFYIVFGDTGNIEGTSGLPILTEESHWLSATALGDVNGDGIDDVVVDQFVVFGRLGLEQLPSLDLDELGSDGLRFEVGHVGIQNAGDLNADGINEIFLSQSGHRLAVGGASGIVLGGESIVQLDQKSLVEILSDQTLAIELPKVATGARPIGDVNGDGFDDVALERPVDSDEWLYVLLGGDEIANRETSESTTFSVANILDAQTKFVRQPSARKMGDLNGDGIDDFAVVYEGGDCDCTGSDKGSLTVDGGVAVILGRFDLGEESTVNRGSTGVSSLGITTPFLSRVDAYSEDRNGDGLHDIVVTAGEIFDRWGSPDTKQYVILGEQKVHDHQFVRTDAVFLGFDGLDGYATARRHSAFPSDVDNDGVLEWTRIDGSWRNPNLSVWLDPSNRSVPGHSRLAEAKTGPLFDVVDIPAGESVIYTLDGKKQTASEPFVATVATSRDQREDDYRNNISPRTEAAYLHVQAAGDLASREDGTVEFKIKNFGPADASIKIDETISEVFEDATWKSDMHPFPESITISTWLPNYGPKMGLDFATAGGGLVPSIASVGDVNGDGFADLNVFQSGLHFGGRDFGADGSFGEPFIWNGSFGNEETRALGDLDGDGFDDFLTRDYWEEEPWRLFGGRAELARPDLPLALGRGSLGSCGTCFELAGDINGDGFADIVDKRNLRRRILFGTANSREQLLTTSTTNADALGVESKSVLPIGDINGDGLSDLIVHNDRLDAQRILFGDVSLQPGLISAREIDGPHLLGRTVGFEVSAGNHDFNGDGRRDLLLTARLNGDEHQRLFVIFGPVDRGDPSIDLADIGSGQTSRRHGIAFVSNGHPDVGDFNGDGLTDIATVAAGNEGVIYFGGTRDDLRSLVLKTDSARQNTHGLQFVAGSDVNGDGVDDLVIQDTFEGELNEHRGLGPSEVAKLLFGRRAISRSGVGPITGEFAIPTGGELTISVSGTAKQTSSTSVSFVVEPTSGVSLNPLTTAVELEVTPALPGDIDGDGHVSFLDFLTLARSFGRTEATFEVGDIDGDGNVGFLDFVILADNFGRSR